ncbi:MAG: DUF2382 domain-containing protein [Gloeocapsa sp. UFS-A4-WI-NPMV-4B04]|jgi:uncharacterized protein (TIGR02271 family)|nr:DUF2382 domain-containing protein [Gloeocapsa sp. UFS-A4-WI-NPMV-4B04]
MALLKLEDFDPNYRDTFEGGDLKGLSVYAEGDEKIGTVSDVLVDEQGNFRYFIVDLGFWIFGKKVLLPVGRSRIDYGADRVYAIGMTREQADHLPEFSNLEKIDYDYEEQVRGVYRPAATRSTMVDTSASLESSAPLEASAPLDTASMAGMSAMAAQPAVTPTYNRDTYDYQQDASLYDLDEQNHQTLKLYQERLVANKQRVKSGEVAIGKHVETETATVAVPVEKERVIIERVTPADAGRAVRPGEATFREGEVAHVEIYEEQASVQKEAFVREEVRVSKEVEQKTVETQETLRREELDVNTTDTPIVDTSKRLPNDRI